MGSFLEKCILFELKKDREVWNWIHEFCITLQFHEIEEWCKIWRKTDLLLEKWHEEFGKFWTEHSEVSKLELWWELFVQSRKRMSLKLTEDLSVMTMKNYTKVEEELTCFKIDMRDFPNFNPSTRKSKKIVF